MPEQLQYAINADDGDVFHHVMDDGEVRIDVRPLGLAKAIGWKSTAGGVLGIAGVVVGLSAPAAVIGYEAVVRRSMFDVVVLILSLIGEGTIVFLVWTLLRHRASHHVVLTAGPNGLSYWANAMEPREKAWPINEIRTVDTTERILDERQVDKQIWIVRVCFWDGEEFDLVTDRPREQLERIAALCREGLRIAPRRLV